MNQPGIRSDHLIFTADLVDLSLSPLRNGLKEKTYVMGAFNPGLCRLPNGHLLLMVRVAEALIEPVIQNHVYSIRWDPEKDFVADSWPLEAVDMKDPRKFRIRAYGFPVYALTSISWLLPVELNMDGSAIECIHYDKIISSRLTSQEYGIEDPRISTIDGRYYMTTCCVSAERHSTMLYVSENGLDYDCMGIVLDHQNKDMLIFEGKINNNYAALTRPLGECYFAASPLSSWHPGAAIHLASSPDLLHWKPSNTPFLRARRSSPSNLKIGGGSPPILTSGGWLICYHGVESNGGAGIYRTFWALTDKKNPLLIIRLEDSRPLLESNPALLLPIKHQVYLEDIVFTTGIAKLGDEFILASGECDLACRITRVAADYFSIMSD